MESGWELYPRLWKCLFVCVCGFLYIRASKPRSVPEMEYSIVQRYRRSESLGNFFRYEKKWKAGRDLHNIGSSPYWLPVLLSCICTKMLTRNRIILNFIFLHSSKNVYAAYCMWHGMTRLSDRGLDTRSYCNIEPPFHGKRKSFILLIESVQYESSV
jgi:hypothetical protein